MSKVKVLRTNIVFLLYSTFATKAHRYQFAQELF